MAENCKYCKHYSDNSKICVISKPCINQNIKNLIKGDIKWK